MSYKPLQAAFKKGFQPSKQTAATTAYQNVTEDLKDLPQLMNANQALKIVNYVVTTDGGLAKRGGLMSIFTVMGNFPGTMLQKFTDDVYIYAYSNKVEGYRFSTDTSTLIHSFAGSNPFSGQRYGGYFFVANKTEKIGRIAQTLAYDAQAVAFTPGAILTGVTTGATATILEDDNAGATGTFTLGDIQPGPTGLYFQDNELLTDSDGGAGAANGTLAFSYNVIADAPIAGVLKVAGPRLYAGNLASDNTAVAYPESDDGTNPPFMNWTVGTNANDPGLVNYRNAGTVNAIDSLGDNIVVLAQLGKWSFTTTTLSNNNLIEKIDDTILSRIDMGGARATVVTPAGMFYVNKGGIWQLKSVGQSNVPFSEQEVEATLMLGINYFTNIDLTNADFAYNAKIDTLFLTCARDSDANNLVVAYNIATGTFSEFNGWNINRFLNDNQTIYGIGSLATTMWRCFDGFSDDGADIWTQFYQELKTGDLQTRQECMGGWVDGFLSPSTDLLVSFDIYDVTGTFVPNKLQYHFIPETSQYSPGGGYGGEGYSDPYGDGSGTGGMIECFDGFGPGWIRNFQRLRVNITGHDKLPHVLVWIKILSNVKINIRRRKMVKVN